MYKKRTKKLKRGWILSYEGKELVKMKWVGSDIAYAILTLAKEREQSLLKEKIEKQKAEQRKRKEAWLAKKKLDGNSPY